MCTFWDATPNLWRVVLGPLTAVIATEEPLHSTEQPVHNTELELHTALARALWEPGCPSPSHGRREHATVLTEVTVSDLPILTEGISESLLIRVTPRYA